MFIPNFLAALAVNFVGSIPKHGIPSLTKFVKRYPSLDATSTTNLFSFKFSVFIIVLGTVERVPPSLMKLKRNMHNQREIIHNEIHNPRFRLKNILGRTIIARDT